MLLALGLFVFGYVVSMTFTSIFYHRALAHEAIEISPRMKKLIGLTGMLITGIDPKGWVCMHRLHHEHSDTPLDPHSPVHTGFWYTFIKQHKSFERILVKLIKRDKEFEKIVRDIPFDVHFLNKMGLWYVPFVLHAIVGLIIGTAFDNYVAGFAYFIGICGHPLQGFLVNAFGHSIGYRNFNCPDQSTNNTFVALTCFGEGYQNNHHRFPTSPKFSIRSSELDFGFGIIKILTLLNVVKIYSDQIPKSESVALSSLEMLENN